MDAGGGPGTGGGPLGGSIGRKLGRLRNMGPVEIAGRLGEAMRTGGDWLATKGLRGPGWTPSLAEASQLMAGLRDRDFFGVPAGSNPGPEFLRRFPEAADHIESVAREILRGRVRLFGTPRDLGSNAPDWHLDWTSQQRFPTSFYRSNDIHALDGRLEGRAVWEANRQQYLVTLGQAYCVTGEERFARRAVRDMQSWVEGNPPFRGINWSEPLECAVRCLSWLWTMRLLSGSASLTPVECAPILGSLWLQTRHTRRHLSVYRSPNTHVLGEALGLLAVGTLLPTLPDATRFQALGTTVFWDHLDRQVAPDGSHREHSTYYHAYTAEMALMAFLLSGDRIDLPRRSEQLRAMARYLRAQTRPDGSLARMGDDDGGRALRLSEEDYYRPRTLACALEAVAEGPRSPRESADLQDCFWYLGSSSLPDSAEPRATRGSASKAPSSRAARLPAREAPSSQPSVSIFPDVGVGVTRLGANGGEAWASIHGNPMGFLTAGHSHASLMAVELSLAGRPVLVDPGTYRYVAEARGEYRGYGRHNVLEIEGLEPPHPVGPFKWSFPAEPWIADLEPHQNGIRATRVVPSGEGAEEVRHDRCIRLLGASSASIEDRVNSDRARQLRYSFHLPPGSSEGQAHSSGIEFDFKDGVRLRLTAEDLQSGHGWDAWTVEREWYWMSKRYGQRERALCVRLRPPPAPQVHTRIRLETICP